MRLKYPKAFIDRFLYWFALAGAAVLVSGNFFIMHHITIPNIGLAVMASCAVLKALIDWKFYKGYPWGVLISFFGIFFVFLLACIINHENENTTSTVLVLRTILLGYPAAVFILPYRDFRFYYGIFMTFIITNVVIGIITLYNYYDLIYIHKAEGLHETWINFIDMMSDKIIPSQLYHHLLSVLTVFAIYLQYVILRNRYFLVSNREKYLHIFCMIFLIGFLHFLSARIGLLVFYTGIVYLGYKRRKLLGIKPVTVLIFFITLIAAMVLIYMYVPTVHIKMQLTYYEIYFYFHSSYDEILNGPEYRLKFYFQAFEIIKNNWLSGVGFDNFLDVLGGRKHPHNTYFYFAIIFGVPLSILLLVFTYLPVFFAKKPVALSILVVMFIHTIYSLTDANMNISEYIYFMSFWIPFMFHYAQVSGKIIHDPEHTHANPDGEYQGF